MINTYELDEALEDGCAEQFIGQPIQWHFGNVGIVQKLKCGKIVIELFLSCDKCERGNFQIFVKSGLHNGAFCYVVDENGKYLANLRDQIVVCKNCQD